MKKNQLALFACRLDNKRKHFPLTGQIELTYRCNLNCVHCYSKGLEDKRRELSTTQWKKILDILQLEGCVYLCFTGGEPLIREDFLELYSYAKTKGFIVTIFTNGQAFTEKVISYLVKSVPFSIEITLNGISGETYESITRVPGSFHKVMRAIRVLKERKLPFTLKTNLLKQNKHEILRIKAFAGKFFDKWAKRRYLFSYDSLIYPRFNLDRTPTNYRLCFKEIKELRKQDPDIWKEYQNGLHGRLPKAGQKRDFLYSCNSWMKEFFIDPYARLRFCFLSDKFSVDLKTTSFREGFYNVFPKLLKEKFKTNSKCRNCRLRPICHTCPAVAYLETGSKEAPVPYYCELAKGMYREMRRE